MSRAGRPKSRPPVWSLDGADPLEGVPLWEHLARVLPAAGRGPLPGGGLPYPPGAEGDPGSVRWAPGARDGVLTSHGGATPGDQPVLAAAAVCEACRVPLSTPLVHLAAERLGEVDGPEQVDRLLEALRDSGPIDRERLAELARWICHQGVTVAQVKSGIAVLGAAGEPRDADLVKRLGLFEDLTLYSVVALTNLLDQPHPDLVDLAKQVAGWGRIHALRRLARTTDPSIRRWMLRGGYENDIMLEYTAFLAVTTGGLVEALQGDVDDELLDHAGVLLDALATGGPAEDMRDYEAAELALELYLTEMQTATATASGLVSLERLARHLADGDLVGAHVGVEACERFAALASRALARPEWPSVVVATLGGPDLRSPEVS